MEETKQLKKKKNKKPNIPIEIWWKISSFLNNPGELTPLLDFTNTDHVNFILTTLKLKLIEIEKTLMCSSYSEDK